MIVLWYAFIIFIFNVSASIVIYTLSLHDALPISFARGDREDLAEIGLLDGRRRRGHGAGRGARAAERPGRRSPGWGARGAGVGDVYAHGSDALHRLHRLAGLPGEGRRIVPGEHKRERHLPLIVHDEVPHHAGREDVATETRVLELGEGALDARPE